MGVMVVFMVAGFSGFKRHQGIMGNSCMENPSKEEAATASAREAAGVAIKAEYENPVESGSRISNMAVDANSVDLGRYKTEGLMK